MPHYIENTGASKLRYLELWQSGHFEDVSLAQWLAFTPYELVKAHLDIDRSVLSRVSAQKTPVVGGECEAEGEPKIFRQSDQNRRKT